MSTIKKSLIPVTASHPLTPLTEKQAKALGKPSTSKAKCRLGIPEDWEVCWTQFGLPLEDGQNLRALARSMDLAVSEMCARVLVEWFNTNRDEIYSAAADFVAEEKTDEDIDKMIAAELRKLERLQAEAAARKAKG